MGLTVAQQMALQQRQIIRMIVHDELLQRQLEQLPLAVVRQIVPKAVSKQLTPIVRAARQRLQAAGAVQTGLLAKSLGKKRKIYKRSGVIVGLVGARSGFKQQVRVRRATAREAWQTAKTTRAIYRNPVHYAHLVEGGTRHSQAKPFLAPAWSANRASMEQDLRAGIGREVETTWARLAKQGQLAS